MADEDEFKVIGADKGVVGKEDRSLEQQPKAPESPEEKAQKTKEAEFYEKQAEEMINHLEQFIKPTINERSADQDLANAEATITEQFNKIYTKLLAQKPAIASELRRIAEDTLNRITFEKRKRIMKKI